MEKRKILLPIILAGVLALGLAGIFMFRATAQDRPLSNGPLPTPEPQPTIVPVPTAVPPVAPTPAAVPQNGSLPGTIERFDAPVPSWAPVNDTKMADKQGQWAIKDGKLQAVAAESESFEESIYLSPVDTTGHTKLSVQAYPTGNQTIGLVFRASDQGYYVFNIFRADDTGKALNVLRRYDATSGIATELARNEQGVGYKLNAWQTLSVEVNNDLITCYFEGQKIFEVQDKTFANGKAGVDVLALGDVQFDNFTVVHP